MITNRFHFHAPTELVSKEMQAVINRLLNADTFVCITNEGDINSIMCKSKNLLLDAIEEIASNDKKFLEELTNIVIEKQKGIKQFNNQ